MAFTYRNGPVVPADIITYKHAGKLVYVKPAENYEVSIEKPNIMGETYPNNLHS